nr:Chain E, Mimetic peptide [Bacteriophage sp.]8DUZ_F Chain F, Mimetic peptide [Bacteriophage sp.]
GPIPVLDENGLFAPGPC